MYSLKELKIAEDYSICYSKHRVSMNSEITKIVTQWG